MKRLLFILLLIYAGPLAGCSAQNTNITAGAEASVDGSFSDNTRQYSLQQTIEFINTGSKQPDKFNLWVALLRSIAPYQEVTATSISPDDYTVVIDEYGNEYVEFEFSRIKPRETITVQIEYKVTVFPVEVGTQTCEGETLEDFTTAELHIESNNPQIKALAQELSPSGETACQQVENFYDYTRENLIYTPNQFSWGAQATFGEMGADCTEYASLMIALARSQGIPARYLEGLLYLENPEANDGRIEHAWLEAYLPGIGWAPIDPTLGRSPLTRDDYLFKVPAERFIITIGRNPSTLRGGSYFTYIYWPGNSTTIKLTQQNWQIVELTP